MQKSRAHNFINNLLSDFKLFIFILLFTGVLRAGFLIVFKSHLAGVPFADILTALWLGARLSLKTAGALMLPGFVFATLAGLAFAKLNSAKIRLYTGYVEIFLLSVLFYARIPYYKEFGNAFDTFLFNTFNDDVFAIVSTAVTQYKAPLLLLLSLITGAAVCYIFKKFLAAEFINKNFKIKYQKIIIPFLIILLIFAAPFVRHGGNYGYDNSIYWKNAARLPQHILNEAVLDDVQAIYRARKLYEEAAQTKNVNFTAEDIRKYAALLNGWEYDKNSLLPLFEKTAKGAKIKKPRHIFLIIGETYMLWPMLEEYSYLNIANGLKDIAARDNAVFVKNFLPASNGTSLALISITLGLPYGVMLPAPARELETSIARIMKEQNYKTVFYYGGFPSWAQVDKFMDLQGFEERKYIFDLGNKKANAWGMEDKYFFEGVKKQIGPEPSFNVILTTTNHPPYAVKNLPPKNIPGVSKDMEIKLQHFEYSDKWLADFINDTYARYPDSIFIITGDHAQRWHIKPDASEYEKTAVPFVLYGAGVSKNLVKTIPAGAHTDIAAVLTELIAPTGFKYYAVGNDFLAAPNAGQHKDFWINACCLYNISQNKLEPLTADAPRTSEEETRQITRRMKARAATAWYFITQGPEIRER